MKSSLLLAAMIALLSATAHYSQKFEDDAAAKDFVFSDPEAWTIADGTLNLVKQSQYKPKHRSPLNIALVADRQFGSFTLEADLMQTGKEYGHRDMCIYFNFQDPEHFYYVHIATKTDDHAHNIFIVNDAARTKISTKTTEGFDWGMDKWQKIKLVRDIESGKIELFINGDKLMEAMDKTFTTGLIGFGSFDDTGRIDNIHIMGKDATENKTGFFKRK